MLGFALPHGSKGSEGDPNAYFSLLTHTKELVLVIFCDVTAEIDPIFRTDGNRIMDGKTDVLVEIAF